MVPSEKGENQTRRSLFSVSLSFIYDLTLSAIRQEAKGGHSARGVISRRDDQASDFFVSLSLASMIAQLETMTCGT